jgi:hypothetical protein
MKHIKPVQYEVKYGGYVALLRKHAYQEEFVLEACPAPPTESDITAYSDFLEYVNFHLQELNRKDN